MRTTLTLLLCGVGIHTVFAQSLRYSIAQPYIGLTAYSKLHSDPLSFTGNQAALTHVRNMGFGMYGERRFMLAETSAYTLAAPIPTRLGNFGIQINYAGFKNFNEQKLGLAYARKLGPMASLGLQFNYYGYRVPGYGNASAINFEIGALLQLSDKLQAGLHVYNPVGGKLGVDKEEKIASAYKLGIGYDASEQFFTGVEIVKEEDKPVNVIAGLQYRFARQFFAKAGMATGTTTTCLGAGVAWKNMRLDIAASYHPQLGISPGVLLIMHVKKRGV